MWVVVVGWQVFYLKQTPHFFSIEVQVMDHTRQLKTLVVTNHKSNIRVGRRAGTDWPVCCLLDPACLLACWMVYVSPACQIDRDRCVLPVPLVRGWKYTRLDLSDLMEKAFGTRYCHH